MVALMVFESLDICRFLLPSLAGAGPRPAETRLRYTDDITTRAHAWVSIAGSMTHPDAHNRHSPGQVWIPIGGASRDGGFTSSKGKSAHACLHKGRNR